MTSRRFITQSCCGRKSFIIELDKPIRKSQMQHFRDGDYLVPECFFNAGVFWVQRGKLIGTASFGTAKVSVQCTGEDCEKHLIEFESLLETATSS